MESLPEILTKLFIVLAAIGIGEKNFNYWKGTRNLKFPVQNQDITRIQLITNPKAEEVHFNLKTQLARSLFLSHTHTGVERKREISPAVSRESLARELKLRNTFF